MPTVPKWWGSSQANTPLAPQVLATPAPVWAASACSPATWPDRTTPGPARISRRKSASVGDSVSSSPDGVVEHHRLEARLERARRDRGRGRTRPRRARARGSSPASAPGRYAGSVDGDDLGGHARRRGEQHPLPVEHGDPGPGTDAPVGRGQQRGERRIARPRAGRARGRCAPDRSSRSARRWPPTRTPAVAPSATRHRPSSDPMVPGRPKPSTSWRWSTRSPTALSELAGSSDRIRRSAPQGRDEVGGGQ